MLGEPDVAIASAHDRSGSIPSRPTRFPPGSVNQIAL
jgi:hypothetical protein